MLRGRRSVTKDDVTKVGYWVDLSIKGAIGIVVSIVGLDYREVKHSLRDLEEKKHTIITEIAILKASLAAGEMRLDRMEKKIDRILELSR